MSERIFDVELKTVLEKYLCLNCLSLCSDVSHFAKEVGIGGALCTGFGSFAPPQPALRTVFWGFLGFFFFFFSLHWMNCLPEITNLLLRHLAEFGWGLPLSNMNLALLVSYTNTFPPVLNQGAPETARSHTADYFTKFASFQQ